MLNIATELGAVKATPEPSTRSTDRDLRLARALDKGIVSHEERRDQYDRLAEIAEQQFRTLLAKAQQARDIAEWFHDQADMANDSALSMTQNLHTVSQRLGQERITDAQVDALLGIIAEVKADTPKFCKFMGVDALPDLSVLAFDSAVSSLNRKRKAS